MYNKKSIIIGVMLIAVVFLSIGYAYFSTTLTINGTSNITTNWNVYFESISEGTITGTATNASTPSVSGTSATISVNLATPGDKIVYELILKNGGDFDAVIEDVIAKAEGSSAIIYSIEGISKGDKLAKGASKTITLSVEYDYYVTSQPELTNKTLTINLITNQDIGQDVEAQTPSIDQPLLLSSAIFRDNTAQSDSGIDFKYSNAGCYYDFDDMRAICDDSQITNGLYYTNQNTENNQTTYYFRGNIENNYVKFGKDSTGNDIIWRIVRINEDGSVRLITQDKVGETVFNSDYWDNADLGYMYGLRGQTGNNAYNLTHKNDNSSTIKSFLDGWYTKNLKENYSSYLADAGFCNDRSTSSVANTWNSDDTALGYGENTTYYGGYNRALKNTPQFECPQTNDLFTLRESNKGNKSLEYPIGLLTIDEAIYAGTIYDESYDYYDESSVLYLNNGEEFWTMSPAYFSSVANMWNVGGVYILSTSTLDELTTSIRPVINVKGDTPIYLEGTGEPGTSTNPYIIK